MSLKAIRKCGWTISKRDDEKRIVKAHTKMTLRSWGEEVVVKVKQSGSASQVRVSSDPKAQLFDWGRGGENVRLFKERLKAMI